MNANAIGGPVYRTAMVRGVDPDFSRGVFEALDLRVIGLI